MVAVGNKQCSTNSEKQQGIMVGTTMAKQEQLYMDTPLTI
jgi:hypothetical protein